MSAFKAARPPRIAVRAVIVDADRLLLVNAWPDGKSDLMCAPGGGVEPHASLPDNLRREVMEETGLEVAVGGVCLVNEFHDAERDFHQIEVFFRCRVIRGELDPAWTDPEAIVTERRWVNRAEMKKIRVKPGTLEAVAFASTGGAAYDALEPILR